MKNSKLAIVLVCLSLLGVLDATYLTWQHYSGGSVVCSITAGCEQVLGSRYAVVYGVPMSLMGMIYHLTLFFICIALIDTKKILFLKLFVVISSLGLITSGYLVYLQAGVINSFCIYCLVSAGVTLLVFAISVFGLKRVGRNVN